MSAEEQQRRFVAIRIHFNDVLSQVDLFMEVITQRSESGTGVWLSGLDRLAADALDLPGCRSIRRPWSATSPEDRAQRSAGPGPACPGAGPTRWPSSGCRGSGWSDTASPRRSSTRSGTRAPRCSGWWSRSAQEIGERSRRAGAGHPWASWEKTVSECVADFWSVGKLGIASTLGLLAVVSLPRFFVFRPPGDDPHPMPYLRVLLSVDRRGHPLSPSAVARADRGLARLLPRV